MITIFEFHFYKQKSTLGRMWPCTCEVPVEKLTKD